MLPFNNITGPCVITICQGHSTRWKRVTEDVLTKGQANNTLPSYVQKDDIICLNYYNGIVVNSSIKFQQHAQINIQQNATESDDINSILSFFKVIKIITDILYTR